MTMIMLTTLMFIKEPLQYFFSKVTSLHGLTTEQDFPQIIIEIASEPTTNRYTETVFFSLDDFCGNKVLQRFLKNVFGCKPPEFQIRRNAGGELKQFLI